MSRSFHTLRSITLLPIALLTLELVPSPPATPRAQANTSHFVSTTGKLNNPPAPRRPVLGWSSWSAFRHQANTSIDEAAARELLKSGLAAEGFTYVDQDDGWYSCPAISYTGPHLNYGPTVNHWGQWVTSQAQTFDTGAFPNKGRLNGIAVLANYVHRLGLKFGIYLTGGISGNAIFQDSPVEANAHGQLLGTPSGYTADQITLGFKRGLKPSQYNKFLTNASNYNCGGMYQLNYKAPGTQLFIDGEADQLASWGVDLVKLDAIFDSSAAEIEAWSKALAQTGRPIALDITEGAYDSKLVPVLERYASQWEFSPDIEAYCCQSVLTDYQNVYIRFNAAALWQPYAGVGRGFNDLDSVEVGNGQAPGGSSGIPSATLGQAKKYEGFSFSATNGLTLPAEETTLALWSLASSPLILGSDLDTLNPTQNPIDYALLHDRQIIAIDQDGIPASRIVDTPTYQVFAKTDPHYGLLVGLFNTNYTQPEAITVPRALLGLPATGTYLLQDLFGVNSDICAPAAITASTNNGGPAGPVPKHVKPPLCPASTPTSFETAGAISAVVPPEGVALYRVTPLDGRSAPPATTLNLSGLSTLTSGAASTATETFVNNGAAVAPSVDLRLLAPSGWTVKPLSKTSWVTVEPGQVVQATFAVTAPAIETRAAISGVGSFSWLSTASHTRSPAPAGHMVTETLSHPVTVVRSLVVVNEVETSTKTVPNQQFVELYNPGPSTVNVSDWKLEYATEVAYGPPSTKPIILATIPPGASIRSHGFYLIAGSGYIAARTKPSANLRFKQATTNELSTIGGGVGLVDTKGFVVDSVGWGIDPNLGYAISASWLATNVFVRNCPAQANGVVPTVSTPTLSSLAPTSPIPPSTPAGASIVRLPDGYNTGSNCVDFSVTSTPSPGSTNAAEPKLTITASSPTMTYGNAVPMITPLYSGFVHGDTARSLPITPICATTANSSSPPGQYPTFCSGAADPKYVLDASSYVNGTLTVVAANR